MKKAKFTLVAVAVLVVFSLLLSGCNWKFWEKDAVQDQASSSEDPGFNPADEEIEFQGEPKGESDLSEYPNSVGTTWIYELTSSGANSVSETRDMKSKIKESSDTEQIVESSYVGSEDVISETKYGFGEKKESLYINESDSTVTSNSTEGETPSKITSTYQGYLIASSSQHEWTIDSNIDQKVETGSEDLPDVTYVHKMEGVGRVENKNTKVTVPAGTFNAILTSVEYTVTPESSSLDGVVAVEMKSVVKEKYWISSVGIVKMEKEILTDVAEASQTIIMELKDYGLEE